MQCCMQLELMIVLTVGLVTIAQVLHQLDHLINARKHIIAHLELLTLPCNQQPVNTHQLSHRSHWIAHVVLTPQPPSQIA